MKNFDIFIRSKKSVIIQILCGLNLFLYGCTMRWSENYASLAENSEFVPSDSQMIQKAKEIEEELATKRDTINSLKFYSEHFDCFVDEYVEHEHERRILLNFEVGGFAQEMYIVIQALKDLSIDKRCLIKDYSEEYSDECILARRNAPKTKIKWFNFQKYLPKDSVIKTEQNFLGLYTMYKAVMHFDDYDFVDDDFVQEWAVRKCYLIKEQTKQEEENCSYEEQEFLENIALGKAPKCSVKYSTLYGKFKQKLKNTRYWYQEKEEGDTEQHTKFGAINLCVPDKIGL